MADAAFCASHPGVPSLATCARCKRALCAACVMESLDGTLCLECFRSRAGKKKLLVTLAAAAMILAGGGLAVFLLFLKPERKETSLLPREPEKVDLGWEYGDESIHVASLLAVLDKDPCDRRAIVDLGNAMNRAQNHAGAIERVRAFLARCGDHPRLKWVAIFAHEQRGEWAEAEKVATELIHHNPHDSDYWWWRAQDRVELRLHDGALADFHQSMAARPNKFAAFRLAAALEKRGAPCPGAFALQYLMDFDEEWRTDRTNERVAELFLAGNCSPLVGRGRAKIGFSEADPTLKTQAAVNGKKGQFIIDDDAGFVVLSRPFAQAAGVVTRDDEIELHAAGQLRAVRLGVADELSVQSARARAVDVAVAESLPPGVDGVVGVSWLWRFRVHTDWDAHIYWIEERGSGE
jgi:aspartyl protease family protein